METKVCIKCNEEQPLSEFRKGHNECLSCERLYQRIHSQDPDVKKKHAERNRKYRYQALGKTPPETYEYKKQSKSNKLPQEPREQIVTENRKEYLKEYLKEYWKEYIKTPEFKKRRKEYQQTETYKKSHSAGQKKWKKTENGKAVRKNQKHKRRTLIKDDEGITLQQWKKVLKNQNNCCNICKQKFNEQLPPEQDHIIPVSKGGRHIFENIQAVCRSCNNSKKAKIDFGYIQAWC